MERNSPFLYQSSIREFTDISNLKLNTTTTDAFKHSLKNSHVDEFNTQAKSSRSSASREKNCIKGITKYSRNSKITELKLDIPFSYSQNQTSEFKQNSGSKTPRNVPSFFDPNYQPFRDPNSVTPKKQTQLPYNRVSKVSSVGYAVDSPYFGQHIQKQNKPFAPSRRFKDEKSFDKDKINFRDSLGSLSKQIKNTLKLNLKNDDYENLGQKKEEPIENKIINTHRRSKAGSIRGDGEEVPQWHQKTSSFFVNGSLNRLKRLKNLDLKLNMDFLNNQPEVQKVQNNSYEKKEKIVEKCPTAKIQTDRTFLGKSSVMPAFLQNDNCLKYSSVVEPLTPQLRTGKKYDPFENEKQKPKAPFFSSSTSQKPDFSATYTHTKTSSNFSNFSSTKTSFLASSSVTENQGRIGKDRDSLSSRGRSSLGRQMTLDDFHVGSVKGEGRFGKFYPAIHKKTGMLVGIKEIKKQALKYMLDQFIQQLKIQTYLDHPNIVKLYGYFCTKQNFYLILEYMEEGSLFSFIKKSRKIPEQEASMKLKQICSAVEYLHENQILHRDIKPENIVMTCDVCKLCDFGWAVYSSTRRKTYCGTLDYVCPQILQGDSYDACVDIWAIGVLAYEMIVGKAPFYNISRKETMKKIVDCKFEFPKQLSSKAKDFIQKALNKNPQYRESVQALNKHEFVN